MSCGKSLRLFALRLYSKAILQTEQAQNMLKLRLSSRGHGNALRVFGLESNDSAGAAKCSLRAIEKSAGKVSRGISAESCTDGEVGK